MPTIQLPDTRRHQQENFPVASWLCPPNLRLPILSIYRFARFADDIADEGTATVADRQQALRHLRDQLRLAADSQDYDVALAGLLEPLRATLQRHQLPLDPFEDLLDAFTQDTWRQRYENRDQLLDYCRRSANPIGRLLLMLHGVRDPRAESAADAICSALQLINFWQDISVDRLKLRVYLPLDQLADKGADAAQVLAGRDSAGLRECIANELDWACQLMHRGSALPFWLRGRMGWELRLVIQGGLRVAEKIRAMNHATLLHRPRLRAWDVPLLFWRALRMDAHA